VHLEADQVRAARDLGLWIVQNPRSNRGNRVGYPRALEASDRVALGTDGYPADMDAEREILLREARSRGESEPVVARRAEAGHELVAERFGIAFSPLEAGTAADLRVLRGGRARHVVVGGRPVVRDGELVTADLTAIREEARAEADHLWARMAARKE
jgi:hypothetical protein